MSRDKQIEEMTIISCPSYSRNKEKKCAGVTDCDCRCLQYHRGEALYNAGYRKSTDLSEEIFAEIEKLIVRRMKPDVALIDDRLITDIAELKKKYTEGE